MSEKCGECGREYRHRDDCAAIERVVSETPIDRLRVVAKVARTVGRHLRDHTCTPGGPCWECSLAGMIDDALEDLEPGDIEEDP